eukprot:jgi/Tetstr1/454351/TSEL_041258.t1
MMRSPSASRFLAATACRQPLSSGYARLLVLVLLPLLQHASEVTGASVTSKMSKEQPEPAEGRLLGERFDCERVAFYKTHKTGSTTLGGILFRVGAAHRKRFHTRTADSHYLNHTMPSRRRADFVINHSRSSLLDMQAAYDRDLGDGAGRITIVRDAVARFVSHFYYFVKPNLPKAELLSGGWRAHNKLAADMGVNNLTAARSFLHSDAFRRTVFLSLEAMDEGLAALHLHCGWPLNELLYIKIRCASCGEKLLSWNGRPVPHRRENITRELEARMRHDNQLDDLVVKAARQKWAPVQAAGGAVLQNAAREIRRQSDLLNEHCSAVKRAQGSLDSQPGCHWLSLTDAQYESLVDQATGEVNPDALVRPARWHSARHREHTSLPRYTVREMMDGYDALYAQVVGGKGAPRGA